MNKDHQLELKAFRPKHDFFVGIDSDGCAFNSMEVKHNDGFSVSLIKHFGLAGISRQVHQVWDFVNLYSKTRGINRFKSIVLVCDFLKELPKVQSSGVVVPNFSYLRDWIKNETSLGNPALAAKIDSSTRAEKKELEQVMAWSLGVNNMIEQVVHNLPPFPGVRDSLQKLHGKADVLVVSATPYEALKREWDEHEITAYVALIAGQEMGSKTEHLTISASDRYPSERILMVGDSPGDLKAAQSVDALFFPINPGEEELSWQSFLEEGIDKFFSGKFAGDYQQELIQKYEVFLPEHPPWRT